MTKMDRMVSCLVMGAAFALSCGTQDGAGSATQVPVAPMLDPVSCSVESDCAAGLACVAGSCAPCSAHAQCQSDVCDTSAANGAGGGACVDEAAVIYVDAGARPACESGDGTRTNPVCEIRDAMARVVEGRSVVRVYPGRYFPFSASGRAAAVFGPGDGTAIVGEEDITAGAQIRSGARVVLDGLDFGVAVLNGVICDSASVTLRRSTARGDATGVRTTNCTVEIDRVRAAGLTRSGLAISGTGTYSVTNSYVSGGDAQAVVFSGSNTGTFQFNTVTGGGEIRSGSIDCGTSPRVIADSIAVTSFPAAGGAQTVGACTHERVVVGSGDTRPDPALIKIDPDLDAAGRLLDTPADAACCIDRGGPGAPGRGIDFFGTPRPQGPGNDIGAHELPVAAP